MQISYSYVFNNRKCRYFLSLYQVWSLSCYMYSLKYLLRTACVDMRDNTLIKTAMMTVFLSLI